MKRLLLSFVLFAALANVASAQLLEGLIFAVGGNLLNREINRRDEKTISAVKIMCDIMIPDGNDSYRFSGAVWDTTTGTSVAMVDGIAFRVKCFSNSEPSRDLTYWLNDRLIAKRKINEKEGVVGDYPIIDASIIEEGANQIKVKYKKQELGSCTFSRVHSVRDILNLAADEEMRQKLYPFGGATYPSLPTFVAQMPDGSVRSFISLEEMKLALTAFQKGNAKVSDNGQPQRNGGRTSEPTKPNPSEPAKSEPWSGKAYLGFFAGNNWTDGLERDLRGHQPRLIDHLQIAVPPDQCLAVLLTSVKPFGVSLVGADDQIKKTLSATRQGDHYELLLRVAMDGKPKATLYIADSERHTSVLELTLKGDRK